MKTKYFELVNTKKIKFLVFKSMILLTIIQKKVGTSNKLLLDQWILISLSVKSKIKDKDSRKWNIG
jgi:hypothetical protein